MPDGPKRVLVVAYDFPPHGAIGTMRTLRVVQRLVKEGWDVTVLTGDPRTFRQGTPVDEALIARIPPLVKVIRVPVLRGFETLKGVVKRRSQSAHRAGAPDVPSSLTPSHLRSLAGEVLNVIDAALAIPDNESGWLMPAVVRGLWECRRQRPDVLYSSAPPWTGQLVARALSTVLRCPWAADFRDPWARAPWREARRRFARRANNLLERGVIRRADAVLFVTRGNLDDFSNFYGAATSRRFHLVPNGCDPSEFEGLAGAERSDKFVLLHAGTLYGARNPLPLVHAVARAIRCGTIARDRFRLRFLGAISPNVDFPAECRRLGIEEVVELIPRVARHESLRQIVSASALLLVQPATTVSIPAKAYEYLAAGRPLLALAEEGETADLVRASGIGVSVRPDAGVEAIEAALLEVMSIASRSYILPAPSLYDGRVHAAATTALLERVAHREQRLGESSKISETGCKSSVHFENRG